MISRAIQDFVNKNNIVNNISNDNEFFESLHSLDVLPSISSNNISKIHPNPDTIRHMHLLNDRIQIYEMM